MKLRYKALMIVGLIGGIGAWLHFKRPVPSVVVPIHLTPHQADQLNQATHALPDYGHGTQVVIDHGQTVVKPKTFGMPFDFGLAFAVGPSSQLYLTAELFYYRHFELLAGAGATFPVLRPRAMIGLGYRLPWKAVDNLSVFIGATTSKEVIAGAYWRFGSN